MFRITEKSRQDVLILLLRNICPELCIVSNFRKSKMQQTSHWRTRSVMFGVNWPTGAAWYVYIITYVVCMFDWNICSLCVWVSLLLKPQPKFNITVIIRLPHVFSVYHWVVLFDYKYCQSLITSWVWLLKLIHKCHEHPMVETGVSDLESIDQLEHI